MEGDHGTLVASALVLLPSLACGQTPCIDYGERLHWIGGRYPGVYQDVETDGNILYASSISSWARCWILPCKASTPLSMLAERAWRRGELSYLVPQREFDTLRV